MTREFNCQRCSSRLRIPHDVRASQVRCPQCGHVQERPPAPALPRDTGDPPVESANPFREDAIAAADGAREEFGSRTQNPYAAPLATAASMGLNFADQRRLASRGVRLVGALLDWGVFLGAMLPGAICLGYADQQQDEALRVLGTVVLATGIAVVTILFWVMVVSTGQSPAKRLLGTRIELTSGGKPGFVRGVLMRNWCIFPACCCLPLGVFLYLADGLTVFGEKRQCIHDILASTIVVRVERQITDIESI